MSNHARHHAWNNMTRAASALLIAGTLAAGCEAVPTEVEPDGPVYCNDLKAGTPMIDADPLSPFAGDNTVYANAPFRIYWFAEYERGLAMNYFGFTGDYIARVTILQNHAEVFSQDVAATPINVASGEHDEVIVWSGLPAGTYTVRVALDPYGQVEQCNSLVEALNNISERELTVEPDPIDSFGTAPSGASEEDEEESDEEEDEEDEDFITIVISQH